MSEMTKVEQPVHGLVPNSMSEAMRLAEMMASARLVPQGLQKSPADCLMVIQQAVRWQLDPFAVAQECSVIQGKLMHSGKLVAAVVNARGNLTQRLSFEYSGGGDDRTIVVSGQLQGESSPRVVDVILKNAKTQNRVWQTQPDQQLMYHGVRVWARRHTPELMLGVYSPEEFDETPARKLPPIPANNVMLPAQVNPETGEITDSVAAETIAPIPSAATEAGPVPPGPADFSTQHSDPPAALDQAVATDPPSSAAATVPKTEAEYASYASAWREEVDDADLGEQRWNSEKDLRNKCHVGADVRESLKSRLAQKIREIRDADWD